MIFFKFRELLAAKERQEGRRILLRDVQDATGIHAQVLSGLNSPTRPAVTNTANVEALCHYFRCTPNDLIEISPAPGEAPSCHVDQLYPNRRASANG